MSEILTMTRPSPGVLVTPGGVPFVPLAVQHRLEELSRQLRRELKIEWITGAHKPYFGLKVRWSFDDPRWAAVRSGGLPEHMAFDLETMFPPDCTGENMVAYIEHLWGERNRVTGADAAKAAERIVDASVASQTQVREAQVDALVERGAERHLSESPHQRRVRAGAEDAHPMVSGGLTK